MTYLPQPLRNLLIRLFAPVLKHLDCPFDNSGDLFILLDQDEVGRIIIYDFLCGHPDRRRKAIERDSMERKSMAAKQGLRCQFRDLLGPTNPFAHSRPETKGHPNQIEHLT